MNKHETRLHAEHVIGWLEGDLGQGESAILHAAFQEDPTLRLEAEALRELTHSLSTIGDTLRNHTPHVDLAEAIMSQIDDLAGVERQVVLATHVPRRIRRLRPFQVVRWALAAMVLMVLGLFLWQQQDLLTTNETRLASDNTRITTDGMPSGDGQESVHTDNVRNITLTPPMLHGNEIASENIDRPAEVSREGMTFRAIADLQLAAFNKDRQALAQLQQWASFSVTDAQELLAQSGLDPNLQALASNFLPVTQAVNALSGLSGNEEEDAYPNFLLARRLYSFTDPPPEVWNVLREWETSDPQNSLPQFMEASLRFFDGEADIALAILEDATQYEAASAYALSSAQYRQDAYEELGVEADSAALLAANRAGVEEYAFLTNLGSALMAEGEIFENEGNTKTAGDIYDAVHQFGAQIVSGAAFANEALAGYDLQMDALNAFERLPESMVNSAVLAASLLDGLAELQPIFDAVSQIFSADIEDSFLLQLVQYQLSEGDLNILDLLPLQ